MNLDRVDSGRDVPNDINVIIEIPFNGDPVKYEVDKATGAMFVDRFMNTAMHYPCNYGYVPHTLSEDGDPVDVLVVTPGAAHHRRSGALPAHRHAGYDGRIGPRRQNSRSAHRPALQPLRATASRRRTCPANCPPRFSHFFQHYKDLEPNKWVKIEGWTGPDEAKQEILASIERFKAAPVKPHF